MKKLLGVLLAIAMSWPASATVLKNVEVVGEIQTIASDVDHNQADFYNSGTSARVLAGLSADLVEDVTANLLFQYANVWGNDDSTGKTVQGYWDQIRVVNANVVLHNLFCAFDVTVGRQFYGDEDSAVMYIGPNHYNAEHNTYASSLDAAKLTYGDDVKAFTFIAGRIKDIDEDEFDATGNTDTLKATLMGADFKLHLGDNVTAQVYGYNLSSVEFTDTDTIPATVWKVDGNAGFYGAKLAANLEAARAAVEYTRNYGLRRGIKENKDTGHMLKADLAADIKAVTVRGTFLYANENFWALGNYTPGLLVGHHLGGDIFDYSDNGVAMFNLGFDFKPFEKWTFALDGYTFQDHRFDHSATLEADLTAKYAHNEYVELFAGVGYAKYTKTDGYTSDYSKANLDTSDNFKGQLGMLIKF